MDEYDERLVAWFDREFWPIVAEEHYRAQKIAEQENHVFYEYWQGYFMAMDKISRYIDESMDRIRDSVCEEDANGG